MLTTANGQPVVVDGGKAGILIELSAQTGKLLWKLPVGVHSGPGDAGLLTEHATPTSHRPAACPLRARARRVRRRGVAAGDQRLGDVCRGQQPRGADVRGGRGRDSAAFVASIGRATGEMVAVDQATGKIEWDDKLPATPYGAAAVTNNVVFTTTYNGYLYAFNAATGAILLKTPLSAGTNAPVTIAGDYVITAASAPQSSSQQPLIIAYRLGATGKLPDTVAGHPPVRNQ